MDFQPHISVLRKTCEEPKPNQRRALREIMAHFNRNGNTKVIVSGELGVGKSYLPKLVAKELKKNGHYPRLYSNFDPTAPGLNIMTLALTNAEHTPVIVVIDEIDESYKAVGRTDAGTNNMGGGRSCHTHNRSTFHNMLDVIGETNNVITIFTTNQTISALQNEYSSYLRRGRADFFIEMTDTSSSISYATTARFDQGSAMKGNVSNDARVDPSYNAKESTMKRFSFLVFLCIFGLLIHIIPLYYIPRSVIDV